MTELIDAIEPTGATEQVRAEIHEMTEDELDLIGGEPLLNSHSLA
jgi:hypothetical protein